MKYYQTFVVEGCGQFPYAMLRRDCCFPATEEAAVDMSYDNRIESIDDFRRVCLGRYIDVKGLLPNKDRWASFGWRVLTELTATVKR